MGTDTVACMTTQVEAINGTMQVLQGGYAAVSGYTYATPACTWASLCKNQDLDKLAAALEETPVSVCVNAGAWNAYTGGVMTSAACGSMASFEQDYCVMATGFNTTAATPYWIVRNSWSNTCGLADDATIPTVEYDGDASAVTAKFEHHY